MPIIISILLFFASFQIANATEIDVSVGRSFDRFDNSISDPDESVGVISIQKEISFLLGVRFLLYEPTDNISLT